MKDFVGIHFENSIKRLCIVGYLSNKIMNGEVLHIICPGNDCKTVLNETFVEDVLDEDMKEKYKR